MTFDKQLNVRRMAAESKWNRSCNHWMSAVPAPQGFCCCVHLCVRALWYNAAIAISSDSVGNTELGVSQVQELKNKNISTVSYDK